MASYNEKREMRDKMR